MKLALMSDIHANLEALLAVLRVIGEEAADRIVCCGDVVGYGPAPEECVYLLRQHDIGCVRGNHDQWALEPDGAGAFSAILRDNLAWTRSVLSAESLEWLEDLPSARRCNGVGVVHASNAEGGRWPYIRSEEGLAENFTYQKQLVCFCGHTHTPGIGIRPSRGPVAFLPMEPEFTVPRGARVLVNVGSVGQPRDGDPRASLVFYDTTRRTIRFRRVAYDIGATQRSMQEYGVHPHFSERLAGGQ